jgi:tetratricopeptide (TPR) repeat protein
MLAAQAPGKASTSETEMRKHYDAAYHLQAAGNVEGADQEHRLFLDEALHHVANVRANIGEYARAEPLYQEALQLDPDDTELQFDYAKAAMDAEDPQKAEHLAAEILGHNAPIGVARRTSLMRIQAEALRSLGQHEQALDLFRSAVALDPSFDNVYALGNAYLWVGDKADGAKVFAKMLTQFGETAVIRMDLGRGYAEANDFPEAITEFRKAIAMGGRLRGVHYSLGACYLSLSDASPDEAEQEFRKELALQPNDPFSYPQLGKIALSQHNYAEAGHDLKRAVALNPDSADNYLLLAQLYTETSHDSDAMAALRKAIAMTTDPSRNHYAIHAAHYQLGRLLIQNGDPSAGKAEMKIAEDLLSRSDLQDQNTLNGKPQVQLPIESTRVASAQEKAQDDAYEKSIAPLLASSYNNLGVHAAIRGDYPIAAACFRQAAAWNPALEGVQGNWGRAAFAAHEYADAVNPLRNALHSHPGDRETRVELGVSQYQTADYAGAAQTLGPIASSLAGNPSLAALYAESQAKSGSEKPVEASGGSTTNMR